MEFTHIHTDTHRKNLMHALDKQNHLYRRMHIKCVRISSYKMHKHLYTFAHGNRPTLLNIRKYDYICVCA